MLDQQHAENRYKLSQIAHHYGEQVHILDDPLATTQLARLCCEDTIQPEINDLVESLYKTLTREVINAELPRVRRKIVSRMQAVLDPQSQAQERGVIEAEMIDPDTQVVTVDIARAGILPSLTCYNLFNRVLNPVMVRQDHLIMSRATDESAHVTGANISGEKIGGPISGRYVVFPDPMGATGTSLSTAIQYYKDTFGGGATRIITVNLIVTPEFIRRLRRDHPEVIMYALRLDRGMSAPDVLQTVPGERWDEERGLNEHDYIVPGGGGFGEIMNNAWI